MNPASPTPSVWYLDAPGGGSLAGFGIGDVEIESAPLVAAHDLLSWPRPCAKQELGARLVVTSHEPAAVHARVAARVLDALPTTTHPMTQFSIGILALQDDSIFARRYREGMPKARHWEAMFDDGVLLLGRLPALAAYIYRRSFKNGEHIPHRDGTLDWSANLCHMMGVDGKGVHDMMRLYMIIHAGHEGGNVSAHAVHLVGSALSDPYYALSAGMNGLAACPERSRVRSSSSKRRRVRGCHSSSRTPPTSRFTARPPPRRSCAISRRASTT